MGQLFDRNFDIEIEREHAERRQAANARYTPADLAAAMEQARNEGFAEGNRQGRAEATSELEQTDRRRHVESLEAISGQIGAFMTAGDRLAAELEQQVLSFVLAVFEKVAPELTSTCAAARAEAEVRAAIAMAKGASTLRIHLPRGAFAALGDELAAAGGFEGRAEVVADDNLREGDARVEWDNGFMEYSFSAICERVLAVLRRAATGSERVGSADDE